ncbi:MAG: metallophosphoesterase [Thermodesulfobacteriota bacterium]|nr:metallophosphoesterase [Thermodesulfobacteriota bacterium]
MKSIKILSVSDIVEPMLDRRIESDLFKGIDLIVSCGDLPPEYLSRLAHFLKAPLYYVRGNHDIRYDDKPPEGGNDLHGSLVRFEGIKILGLEGSHWYNGGPHQYTEGQMRAIIRRLRPTLWWRGGVDVVITHAPPRHIHDAEDPCHKGFECFRWLIDKYHPGYFIHGHIHTNFSNSAERLSMVNSTKVINTCGYYLMEIKAPAGIPGRSANARIKEKDTSSVKSFKDQQKREEAFDSRDRGIRTVALNKIMGSVGRYQDFDNQFRFKQKSASERYQWIKKAMQGGLALKPVVLYEIKDEYYVLDGNHRVAAAKEMGHDEILAHIMEFIPSKKTLENLLFRERAEFADRTQLPTEINLTEVSQYAYLIDQISEHQEYMLSQKGHLFSIEKAALDWYRTIYRPLCTIIQRSKLLDSFPGRTDADLYAYITFYQWKEGRKRCYEAGIGKLIEQNMEKFRQKMTDLKNIEYPEMKRGITVFILMSVQAKKEEKLIDKLFLIKEVREIYSVHGDVDLLVKVELTRDLLSSDAEVISQFVQNKVRQLPGILSTNTLIPGFSKVKRP